MRVGLSTDVDGVGKKGDIVEVADGLRPQLSCSPSGKAFLARDGVVYQAHAMRRSRDLKDARTARRRRPSPARLVPTVITITARAGAEGKLFGSLPSPTSSTRCAASRPASSSTGAGSTSTSRSRPSAPTRCRSSCTPTWSSRSPWRSSGLTRASHSVHACRPRAPAGEASRRPGILEHVFGQQVVPIAGHPGRSVPRDIPRFGLVPHRANSPR